MKGYPFTVWMEIVPLMTKNGGLFEMDSANNLNQIPMSNKGFQAIIKFYLFESPVQTFNREKKTEKVITPDQPHPKYNYKFKRVSKRGVTFKDRGIVGAKLNSFRAAMARVAPVTLIPVEANVIEKEKELSNSSEYIIIRKNDNNVSITEGYFYMIRNSFAHGDFVVYNKVYKLKNESNGVVKGVARLKESSLLAWINLFNLSIEDIKKAGK